MMLAADRLIHWQPLAPQYLAEPVLGGGNRPIVVTPLGVKLCRPSETVLCLLPSPR